MGIDETEDRPPIVIKESRVGGLEDILLVNQALHCGMSGAGFLEGQPVEDVKCRSEKNQSGGNLKSFVAKRCEWRMASEKLRSSSASRPEHIDIEKIRVMGARESAKTSPGFPRSRGRRRRKATHVAHSQ